MSSFCPTCANMLHIPGGDEMFFCCKSCPYRHPIQTEVRFPLKLQTKRVDDILGGAEAWDNVDKIQGMFAVHLHVFHLFLQSPVSYSLLWTPWKCLWLCPPFSMIPFLQLNSIPSLSSHPPASITTSHLSQMPPWWSILRRIPNQICGWTFDNLL